MAGERRAGGRAGHGRVDAARPHGGGPLSLLPRSSPLGVARTRRRETDPVLYLYRDGWETDPVVYRDGRPGRRCERRWRGCSQSLVGFDSPDYHLIRTHLVLKCIETVFSVLASYRTFLSQTGYYLIRRTPSHIVSYQDGWPECGVRGFSYIGELIPKPARNALRGACAESSFYIFGALRHGLSIAATELKFAVTFK